MWRDTPGSGAKDRATTVAARCGWPTGTPCNRSWSSLLPALELMHQGSESSIQSLCEMVRHLVVVAAEQIDSSTAAADALAVLTAARMQATD
jgi:hypothetical protein